MLGRSPLAWLWPVDMPGDGTSFPTVTPADYGGTSAFRPPPAAGAARATNAHRCPFTDPATDPESGVDLTWPPPYLEEELRRKRRRAGRKGYNGSDADEGGASAADAGDDEDHAKHV